MVQLVCLLTLLAATPLSAATPGAETATSAVESIQADIRAHVAFLADDLLEGRETSFRGQKLAGLYLATQMQLSGVTPFGNAEQTSFMQPFDVEVLRHREHLLRVEVSGNGPKHELNLHEDFRLRSFGEGRINHDTSMVYLGYGLNSHPHNDFSGTEIEGKWVVMHAGQPDAELGESHPYSKIESRRFSNWFKIRNALNGGAVGVILLEEPREDHVPAYLPPMHSISLPNDGGARQKTFPVFRLNEAQRPKFFGPKYLAKIQAAHARILKDGTMEAVLMKRRRLAVAQVIERETRPTENVVGVVHGGDPNLKDEYLVLSAHYDHLGFDRDTVYNGADDNGSGCATLLLLAKHFAANPGGRGLIIVFYSGEEQGLLGSEYFINNLPVPLAQIVANINIDMVGRNATDRIGVIPSASDGVSSLNRYLNQVHRGNERGFTFDKSLDRFHRRSDQLHFARKEIPNMFFFADVHEHYHSHMDDWQFLDYDKLARFYLLMRDFHQVLLTSPKRPEYVELEAFEADPYGPALAP
ncbi:M28 family peptidase [Acanthopleuribacter pedis]|uniref:M28 family peptidase n=1 Tax=Acanthopleuribacter pedis TaxID=442870 RepID=A0A8J7QIB7_9BACT|nr:M28 family peptidase [Acanthopleuribacter pedis]MBO1321236.1 M28 family peptidase [Acanthopleuribacter pedis]